MTRLVAIAAAVNVLEAGGLYCLFRAAQRQYKEGFQHGHKEGYRQGHLDADNWWIGTEGLARKAPREEEAS